MPAIGLARVGLCPNYDAHEEMEKEPKLIALQGKVRMSIN